MSGIAPPPACPYYMSPVARDSQVSIPLADYALKPVRLALPLKTLLWQISKAAVPLRSLV
jgi:hypothetical protein